MHNEEYSAYKPIPTKLTKICFYNNTVEFQLSFNKPVWLVCFLFFQFYFHSHFLLVLCKWQPVWPFHSKYIWKEKICKVNWINIGKLFPSIMLIFPHPLVKARTSIAQNTSSKLKSQMKEITKLLISTYESKVLIFSF